MPLDLDGIYQDGRQEGLIEGRAEIERLQELLRGVGANRYWEGRWHDEQETVYACMKKLKEKEAEIERLRAALKREEELHKETWDYAKGLEAKLVACRNEQLQDNAGHNAEKPR